MVAYRIRHIPTGLFFAPSRLVKAPDGEYEKSNFSKKGKAYMRRPSLNYLGEKVYVWGQLVPVILTDWSIEEIS